MDIVHGIEDARQKSREARKASKRIGFVPTMGFLHRGHLSLVDIARTESEYQVMSIFVNKIQFNDRKDYETYPRDLERDFELARGAGVDLMFVPEDSEIYSNQKTYVDVETLTDFLCGAHRPGHFRGVFTGVSKLFNIIQPDVSVFGQKDLQQAVSIEKMVADLNFPVRIILGPIIREEDGLAMSSRNKHLSADERKRALVLSRSLCRAGEMIDSGVTEASAVIGEMTEIIRSGRPDTLDYVTLVNRLSLQPSERIDPPCAIAVAAFFGTTRLIDNMIIDRKGDRIQCTY